MNWINQAISLIVITLFSFTILYYWKPQFICKYNSKGEQLIDWYIIILISILIGLSITASITLCYVKKPNASLESEEYKETKKEPNNVSTDNNNILTDNNNVSTDNNNVSTNISTDNNIDNQRTLSSSIF